MVKLEELRDEFDEAMKVENNGKRDDISSKLTEEPVSKQVRREEPARDKPFEDVMSELSQVPIFMDNLDLAGGVGRTLNWSEMLQTDGKHRR